MTTLTKTYTRPDLTVDFPVNSSVLRTHLSKVYRGADLLILSIDSSTSADKLTMTIVTTFRDAAAMAVYLADPVVVASFADIDAFCSANGIAVSRVQA